MRKRKILAFLVLSLLFSLSINQVKATDELTDAGGAKVSTSVVTGTPVTGTEPFDDNDDAGNDSSDSNNIVRSFDTVKWTIENTLVLEDNASTDGFTGGKLYFEATLPDCFTSETAQWDTDEMGWLENYEISDDGLTISGYYTMSTEAVTIPGKQNLTFTAKILGAANGTTFQPTIKVWLSGNTDDKKVTTTGFTDIIVSAAPGYNIRLVQNTDCAIRTTVDIDGEEVTGRMYGYAVVYQLYNTDTEKGLKGIEYPTGDITLDLEMSLTTGGVDTGVTPILYDYQIACESRYGILGRDMFVGANSYSYFGNSIFVRGKVGSSREISVLDSGNISVTQDKNILSLTLTDYQFDGIFPIRNYNSSQGSVSYGTNIGCFGSIYLQVLIPDFDDYDENNTYTFEVSDTNFSATSASGITTTLQEVTDDDSRSVTYTYKTTASFSSVMRIASFNDQNDLNITKISNIHSLWYTGDGKAYRDQKLLIGYSPVVGSNNEEEDTIRSMNLLYKFDGEGLEPIVINGNKYYITNYSTSSFSGFNVWYATKKDGTNWSSQDEMRTATVEDLMLYESIEDIPDEDICVGVYLESQGIYIIDREVRIFIPVEVKSTATIGQTYGTTYSVKLWSYELDRDTYTVTNEDVEWPTDYLYQRTGQTYIKSEYDDNGNYTTHTNAYNGQTVYVIGAEQSVTLTAVDSGDAEKTKYDFSKNEYNVTYKIEPSLTNDVTSENITDVAVKVYATLPSGMSYVAESCDYGEPEITQNEDGTTTLEWLVTGCTVNETIDPIYFDAHLSESTTDGTSYAVSATMYADYTKVGATTEVDRTDTTTVQVVNLASHRLYKTVEENIIEKNGEIHYTISYTNNTSTSISDFQLLDILPYNGDTRGTSYTGTYTLSKLVVTQKDLDGNTLSNDNLTISYTNDTSAQSATCKDSDLGSTWTEVTTSTIGKAATAFAVTGEVAGQSTVTVDIYLQTSNNTGLDKYVNNATAQIDTSTEEMTTGNLTALVVKRKIEGTVWYDADADGIMDDDEEVISGIEISLTDADGAQVIDEAGNIVENVKTDEYGYYSFNDLPMDNYYVKITMPEEKYELTEKEVGFNSTINSKFNVDTNESDEITKLNSNVVAELTVSDENAGIVKKETEVIVNYVDYYTNETLKQTIIDGRVDDEYETTQDDIDGYTYYSTVGTTSGNMTIDTIEVTYYYKKNSSVIVKYVDKYTNEEIIDTVTISGLQGDAFQTEQKAISGYVYDGVAGNVSGTMLSNNIIVTYYYLKQSTVTSKYVDYYTGSEISDSISAKYLQGNIYATSKKTIEGYTYYSDSGNTIGTVGDSDIEVTYSYKKNSSVTVKYIDKNTGDPIAQDITISGQQGDSYSTEQKSIDGYVYSSTDGAANGTLSADATTVTYYYKKASSVTAKYLDVEGNEIADAVTISGSEGDSYTTEQKTISGYVYDDVIGTTSGNMTDEAITVIYYYKKQVTLTLRYVDYYTNEEIAPSDSYTYYQSDEYTCILNGVSGYTLYKDSGNTTGTVSNSDIEVIYYFKKQTSVEVKYVDKYTSKEIVDTVTLSGLEGDVYQTEQKEISGYVYDSVSGTVSGTMLSDKTTVTYYYIKQSTVTTNYVDYYTGLQIETSSVSTYSQGNYYATSSKTIEGYTLYTDSGNTTGTVADSDIEVTYSYKKNSTVTVKYIDKYTDNQIATTETISAVQGDNYTTQKKDIAGYVYDSVDGTTSGTLGADATTVTYYYIKQSTVTTKYVDYYTNEEIADEVLVTYLQKESYTTNQKEVSGYTYYTVTSNSAGTMGDSDITVIYSYKKNTSVVVKYVDLNTDKEIEDQVVTNGVQGDSYTTEQKEISGYVYNKVVGQTSGEMEAETITVTYYYVKQSTVTVKYVDYYTDLEIAEGTTTTLSQGALYDSQKKTISGYTYYMDTNNTTGTVEDKNIEVVYYYKKNTSVIVKYVDKYTDSDIATQVTISGLQGNSYTTEQKEIDGYKYSEVAGKTSGEMEADTITVTYYYVKQSTVTVKYLDYYTNSEIATSVSTTYSQKDSYKTEKKEVTGYTYYMDTDNTTGTVEDTNIEVTYYYKKNTSVKVQYIDMMTSDTISSEVEITGLQGDTYTTEQKEIDGYAFIQAEGTTSGNMSADTITVVYKYKKESNLITSHVDANSNEKIVDDVVATYNEGDTWNSYALNLEGYVLVESPQETTGTVGRENITKTYYYKKISQGLVVKYVDIISKELLAQEEYTGNENDVITLEEKSFANYVISSKPESTTVTLTVDAQEVTYYYVMAVEITVKGIDKDTGDTIYETTKSGLEGDEYTTTPRQIAGYELVENPANQNGTLLRDSEDVVYGYRKISGGVTVRYVDKDTNEEIADSVTFTGLYSDPYKAEEKQIEDYELVEVVGSPSGTLQVDAQEVVYYYEKKAGKVVVTYEDIDGNVLSEEELTDKVGKTYETEEKEIEGYRLVEIPENATGTYIDGTIEVKYVYRMLGTITVKFVDENGEEIQDKIESTDMVGEEYVLELPQIDGYTLVGDTTIKTNYIEGELVYIVSYEKIVVEESTENVSTGDIALGTISLVLVLSALGIIYTKKRNNEKN